MAGKAAAAAPVKQFTYLWEGRDRAGRTVRGEMRAGGVAVVNTTLRRQGVMVTKVKKRSYSRGRKVTEKDITLFTRQLATMMRAGVPLLQAFDIVAKGTENGSVARLFTEIKSDVETGTALSEAFRRYPLYFDDLFCNLVGAGEQAGILDDLLERLAVYKEKMQALKGKIKSALFYPTAVMGVAAIVVTIIMLFVIPAFKSVFEGFGASLPAPTLMVIAMSDIVVAYWWLIFGLLFAGIYFLLQAWRRSAAVQVAVDRGLLRLPILGEVIRKASIARWLRTLSTMFAAGVPLVEALDSVGGASGNHVYLTATRRIQGEVSTGTSLTVAMQNANVFPNMVMQMASIGEESGSLDDMLGKAADIYEREVDEAVASLSSLLEPIIMAFLGVVIGGLVVAMYLPIFKMGQVV
ncbi:MAG: type II secretion system F family protein [Betaproteobacteria bacterium]|nr:type II secretion system F family protein [Betaproteobacteria bacterium]